MQNATNQPGKLPKRPCCAAAYAAGMENSGEFLARKLGVEEPKFVDFKTELRGFFVNAELIVRKGGVVFKCVFVFIAV